MLTLFYDQRLGEGGIHKFRKDVRETGRKNLQANVWKIKNAITRIQAQLYPSALKGTMFGRLGYIHHSKFVQIPNITKLFDIGIPIQTLYFVRCLPHFQNGGFYREKVYSRSTTIR